MPGVVVDGGPEPAGDALVRADLVLDPALPGPQVGETFLGLLDRGHPRGAVHVRVGASSGGVRLASRELVPSVLQSDPPRLCLPVQRGAGELDLPVGCVDHLALLVAVPLERLTEAPDRPDVGPDLGRAHHVPRVSTTAWSFAISSRR